jgi:hypothetical protein
MFLFFLPPIIQVLIGVGLFGAGVATQLAVLEAIGGLGIVVGGYRQLRKRRGGGAAR